MKKRILFVLLVLIILCFVIYIANKNKETSNININEEKSENISLEFCINNNFFEDLNKEFDRKNLVISSTGKQYIKKQVPFEINALMIPCQIVNINDEKGNEISYLRLPSWIKRYTDIKDVNIKLNNRYENNTNMTLELKNISVSNDNKWNIGESLIYEQIQEQSMARMDFLFTYLEEKDK